jgi:DNA-binding response OmpR family regulator
MKRLLIVDDDSFMRLGLGAALKQEGFTVAVAPDGAAGFRLAQSFHPDLILCDVMMPILNGLQLKQKLNQYEHLAHIPILFISGRDQPEEIDYALSIGAEGYLLKPIKFDDLLSKIKSILRLHRKGGADE